jgi:hypothetical protein
LTRAHKVIQCERCFTEFPSKNELIAHIRLPASCDLREGKKSYGITQDIEAQLKKRDTSGLSDHEQWRNIWNILFPNELPHKNPCESPPTHTCGTVKPCRPINYSNNIQDFEPVHDNIATPVDLDEYERYMRQNLPRVFKDHVGHKIEEKLKEIENHLGLDILSMIRLCQGHLITEYRTGEPLNGRSHSAPSHLETHQVTRGHTTAFEIATPRMPLQPETPRTEPGIGFQTTPPDSETRPPIGFQGIRPSLGAHTASEPPNGVSMSIPQHPQYMYSTSGGQDLYWTCHVCSYNAEFCLCPRPFALHDNNGSPTMGSTVGNTAIGDSAMENSSPESAMPQLAFSPDSYSSLLEEQPQTCSFPSWDEFRGGPTDRD